MHISNNLNLPGPIVTAVTKKNYDPGVSDITVTTLIDSPQIRTLRNEYENVLVEDASMRIWSLFGDAIHQILDDIPENKLVTARLYLPVELEIDGEVFTYTIGGLVDRCVLMEEAGQVVLQDYKTATTWEAIYGLKEERKQQLNLYKFMIEKTMGIKVDVVQAVMLYKDWTAGQIDRNKDYPRAPIGVFDIELWTDERTIEFIEERLVRHFHTPPYCTSDERWEKQSSFRLVSDKRKTAYRVTQTRKEMDDYLEWCIENKPNTLKANPTVEQAPARQIRCEKNALGYSYCPVAEYCPQWATIQTEE